MAFEDITREKQCPALEIHVVGDTTEIGDESAWLFKSLVTRFGGDSTARVYRDSSVALYPYSEPLLYRNYIWNG